MSLAADTLGDETIGSAHGTIGHEGLPIGAWNPHVMGENSSGTTLREPCLPMQVGRRDSAEGCGEGGKKTKTFQGI